MHQWIFESRTDMCNQLWWGRLKSKVATMLSEWVWVWVGVGVRLCSLTWKCMSLKFWDLWKNFPTFFYLDQVFLFILLGVGALKTWWRQHTRAYIYCARERCLNTRGSIFTTHVTLGLIFLNSKYNQTSRRVALSHESLCLHRKRANAYIYIVWESFFISHESLCL